MQAYYPAQKKTVTIVSRDDNDGAPTVSITHSGLPAHPVSLEALQPDADTNLNSEWVEIVMTQFEPMADFWDDFQPPVPDKCCACGEV